MMNEKFFDLKKEKQDRIIDAALKVFALNGYAHASTDEIVKAAKISKGLLFHYFGSKIGLYAFLCDYSVRFMAIELQTYVAAQETDYFRLVDQILTARVDAMRQFPYVELFLERASEEDHPEAMTAAKPHNDALASQLHTIMERADITRFHAGADYVITGQIISYLLRGMMERQLHEEAFRPERYAKEASRYLDMIRRLSYT